MVFGVTKKSGRGIPACIIQQEETTKDKIEKARGTLKVAMFVGDKKIQGLVALSYYDTKPFYMLTNAAENVEFVTKKRKIFDKSTNTMKDAPFYRLNVINDYNNNMNNVDIADQLRGTYWFDRWMRKTKWWWSMFFWGFQMLLTNLYVTYKIYANGCVHVYV